MPFARRFTAALAVLFAAAGSLAAQGAAQSVATGDPQVPAVAAPSAGQTATQPVSLAPFEQNASVGVHASSPSGPVPIAPPRREHVGSNVALMIVGGALIVVGAIMQSTAGDFVMVGGAVVGVIGLYRYLQ